MTIELKLKKPQYAVLILGSAGAGKTTLTGALCDWINSEEYSSASCVNLDPGAEQIPYSPVWDIRNIFTVREIMRKYNLGPNGALLKSMDLLLEMSDSIIKEITTITDSEYLVIDTPGQLEIFTFRDVGENFVKKLSEKITTIGLFLIDGELFKSVTRLLVSQLLGLSAELNLSVPLIHIINKGDLVNRKLVEKIDNEKDTIRLIIDEKGGSLIDLGIGIYKIIRELKAATRPILVSAKNRTSLDELFDAMHEVFCTCGDMT